MLYENPVPAFNLYNLHTLSQSFRKNARAQRSPPLNLKSGSTIDLSGAVYEPLAVARLVQGSGRFAAVLLAPIVVIAIYAPGFRVGGHGWTTSRIVSGACLLIAAIYPAGYTWAALRPGRIQAIAGTNIVNAFVVLGMVLVLLSPLGDSARLSVANQVVRFESGKVAADKFHFAYLCFEGARYSQAALERLRASAQGKESWHSGPVNGRPSRKSPMTSTATGRFHAISISSKLRKPRTMAGRMSVMCIAHEKAKATPGTTNHGSWIRSRRKFSLISRNSSEPSNSSNQTTPTNKPLNDSSTKCFHAVLK